MRHGIVHNEWRFYDALLPVLAVLAGKAERGSETAQLARTCRRLFDNRPVALLDRGRTGLALVLRALKRRHPARTDVIIPAYICPSVPDLLRALGLQPVAVEVSGDLTLAPDAVAAAISPRCLGVIAAHVYACPADVGALEILCREHGVALIDDAAQVAGISVDGRALGSFGIAGICSFSQSKTISVGHKAAGGVLILNDPDLAAEILLVASSLPPARYRLREHLGFVLTSKLGDMEYPLYYWRKLFGQPRPRALPEAQIANANAKLALRQIETLPQRIEGRRRIAAQFAAHLPNALGMPQFAPGRYLSRILVQTPEGVSAEELRRQLRRQGVQTRRAYPVLEGRFATKSQALSDRLLEVPSWSRMPESSVRQICAALERGLVRVNKGEPA